MKAADFEDTCRLECAECNFVWEGPEGEVERESDVHNIVTGHYAHETAPRGGMPGPRTKSDADNPYELDAALWGMELPVR